MRKKLALRLPACAIACMIAATFFTGCGGSSSDGSAPTQLRFSARINGQPVECGVQYDNVGNSGATVQIQDFRFYISQVALIRADGSEVPVSLVEDGLWQLSGLALLDFENATGACAELGTPEMNNVINFSAPEGDYVGVRYTLGVPFELNHQDSTTAASPLNLGAMQWNWQIGYKFARIDLLNENAAPNNRWFIHLGSTGCESNSNVTAPSASCARPNRVEVLLSDFNADANEIVIDIGQFLSGANVGANTADTLPGCMSTPTDPECSEVFRALGLSLQSGQNASGCDNCQELFTVE